MRRLPFLAAAAVLALLALAGPTVLAQPPTYSQAYQVRAAIGDIPTTDASEPTDGWNVEQRLTVQFDNGTQAQHGFSLPDGADLVNATCTCNPSHVTATSDSVVFTLEATLPSGAYTLTVLTTQEAGPAITFAVTAPLDADSADDRVAVLYVPAAADYTAASEGTSPGLSTDGSARIVQFLDLPSTFWAAIHPDNAVVDSGGGAGGWNDDVVWLFLALGLVAGAILWAILVSRGIVQAKSRRQVAATAAHVEAAADEPAPVLEGRKRALLAALKEIEVAKMNNEMAPEVYDAVKADLKKQAVTVMRALEAGAAEPKA